MRTFAAQPPPSPLNQKDQTEQTELRLPQYPKLTMATAVPHSLEFRGVSWEALSTVASALKLPIDDELCYAIGDQISKKRVFDIHTLIGKPLMNGCAFESFREVVVGRNSFIPASGVAISTVTIPSTAHQLSIEFLREGDGPTCLRISWSGGAPEATQAERWRTTKKLLQQLIGAAPQSLEASAYPLSDGLYGIRDGRALLSVTPLRDPLIRRWQDDPTLALRPELLSYILPSGEKDESEREIAIIATLTGSPLRPPELTILPVPVDSEGGVLLIPFSRATDLSTFYRVCHELEEIYRELLSMSPDSALGSPSFIIVDDAELQPRLLSAALPTFQPRAHDAITNCWSSDGFDPEQFLELAPSPTRYRIRRIDAVTTRDNEILLAESCEIQDLDDTTAPTVRMVSSLTHSPEEIDPRSSLAHHETIEDEEGFSLLVEGDVEEAYPGSEHRDNSDAPVYPLHSFDAEARETTLVVTWPEGEEPLSDHQNEERFRDAERVTGSVGEPIPVDEIHPLLPATVQLRRGMTFTVLPRVTAKIAERLKAARNELS